MSKIDELLDAENEIVRMHQAKALSDSGYYQCLVTLASDIVCEHHELEYGLILLNKCPPEYFDVAMPAQMQLDKFFASAALHLVYRLVQLGVTLETIENINVPPAEA
jgi:hypothetical protein